MQQSNGAFELNLTGEETGKLSRSVLELFSANCEMFDVYYGQFNVLISPSKTPVLADFGLSALDHTSLTTIGTSARGTARWMAKELLDFNNPHALLVPTRKSDIWALGMVTYVRFFRVPDEYTSVGNVDST